MSTRRSDPEVQALAAQFRSLSNKARGLVADIDVTILMLDEYQKKKQQREQAFDEQMKGSK
jgi:predicted secreted acid phosphatase